MPAAGLRCGMRGVVDSIGRRSGLLPSVLALLLLFRLMVPAGYMIAPGSEGGPGLVLCAAPAQAAVEPALHSGHDGHPADPAPTSSGERPCAYAALAAPPIPPEAPSVPPSGDFEALPPDPAAGPDLPRVAPASAPPPARGPPIPV